MQAAATRRVGRSGSTTATRTLIACWRARGLAAPSRLPFYPRRAVIGSGIAAAATLDGVGGWLAFRPGAPPNFTGKWEAAKVQIAVVPLGNWTIALADLLTAAFTAGRRRELRGHRRRSVQLSISVEDHGTIAITPKNVTKGPRQQKWL
jgi:hypothetical protein